MSAVMVAICLIISGGRDGVSCDGGHMSGGRDGVRAL